MVWSWLLLVATVCWLAADAYCALLPFFPSVVVRRQIVQLLDIEPPPVGAPFRDVYLVQELMEFDLHRVIQSRQALTVDHVKFFLYQVGNFGVYVCVCVCLCV